MRRTEFGGWPGTSERVGTTLRIVDRDSGATLSAGMAVFSTVGIFRLDIVVVDGDYVLVEVPVWGAGGGGYSGAGGSRKGGGAGFITGTVKIRTGRYVVVVGAGGLACGDGAGIGQAPWRVGRGGVCGISGFGGWGGGLSGIFEDRDPWTGGRPLLVAAGGGGAGYSAAGGPGGGYTGGNSADGNATGGTQTAPGSSPTYGTSGSLPADAFRGGSAIDNTDGGGGGGGGSGFYGGGNGANNTSDGGGAGGSSYAAPDDVLNPSTEAGSGDATGGASHPRYPGSSIGVGGAAGSAGNGGYLIMVWPKAA